MLLDDRGKHMVSAESGLGKNFTPLLKELKRGNFPACVQHAQAQSGSMEITNPSSTCADCPITDTYSDKGRMIIRMEHAEKVYGVLSVSFGVDITIDEEELSLFKEVAGDIAFALFSIELEGKRDQAEKALREERNFSVSLVETAQTIILVLDVKGRILRINPYMEEISGYTLDEVRGKDWFNTFLPPADFSNIRAIFQKTVSDVDVHSNINIILTKDGRERMIDWYNKTLNDHNGNVIGVLSVGQDITERVKAEEKLQESEEKYHSLFSEMAEGVYLHEVIYNKKGKAVNYRIIETNPASEKHLNIKQEDAKGKLATELYGTEEAPYLDDFAKVAKTGIPFNFEEYFPPLKKHLLFSAYSPEKGKFATIFSDITKRKVAEQQLKLQSLALNSASNAIVITDIKGTIEWANPAFATLTGYTIEETINKNPSALVKSGVQDRLYYQSLWETILAGNVWRGDLINKRKDGQLYHEEMAIAPLLSDEGEIINFVAIKRDITERMQAQERERQHVQDMTFLTETAMSFVEFPPEKDIYDFLGKKIQELIGKDSFVVVTLTDQETNHSTIRAVLGMGEFTENISRLLGRHPVGMTFEIDDSIPFYPDGKVHLYEEGIYGLLIKTVPGPICKSIEKLLKIGKIYVFDLAKKENFFGSIVIFLKEGADEFKNKQITELFLKQASIAVQKRQAEESLQQYTHQLKTLNTVTAALSTSLDLETVLDIIFDQVGQVLPYDSGAIFLYEEDGLRVVAGRGITSSIIGQIFPAENELFAEILDTQAPLILNDVKNDPRFENWGKTDQRIMSWMGVPLVARGTIIGIQTFDKHETDAFSSELAELIQPLAAQAAQAIENARQFNDAQRRMALLEALHAIDLTISSSMNLNITAEVFVNQILTVLQVDAATLLLFNPATQTLECLYRKGFRTSALEHTYLKPGQGLAGQVVLQKKVKHVPDLRIEGELLLASSKLSEEEFIAYYGVPLIAQGKLKGVLEVFHRTPLSRDKEWLAFLNTLVGQAAIAIDNSTLFDDLQDTHEKLVQAYNATIEGWAKALEIRDMETVGHSRRVVDLTIPIAQKLGFTGEKLIHIRRGALLHDIGKMGVPDSILQKNGPLSDEEWRIMRLHPVYAFEWISSIEYLQPALDIPYCHHEKWDGTGYPRGLQGEQIPLSARIFAVVDVWDALLSDRPYRKAWSKEKTIAYIKEQSGKHFDPQVVDAFIEHLGESDSNR